MTKKNSKNQAKNLSKNSDFYEHSKIFSRLT